MAQENPRNVMPVRNVTKDYPPTLLIHGTKDTDVPYQQSVMMAEQFKKHGVAHKLISIKNGEHGLVGGDRRKSRRRIGRRWRCEPARRLIDAQQVLSASQ